jgi:hypothetical protein
LGSDDEGQSAAHLAAANGHADALVGLISTSL